MEPRVIPTRLLFWADGFTWGPTLIWVRPNYADDRGLIAHETAHARAMARDGTWRFRWRYLTSRKWRLIYEVEGYRESLKYDPKPSYYAGLLASNYWLGITRETAYAALTAESKDDTKSS